MNPREIRTDVVERGDSKARLDLESRVLSAALKQSFERGDVEGVSLAHRQLFLLLKSGHKPDLGNGDAKKRLSSENITIPGTESEESSSEQAAEHEDTEGGTVSEDAEAEGEDQTEETKGPEPAETDVEQPAAVASEPEQELAPEAERDRSDQTAEEPAAEQYDASKTETLPPTPVQALAQPPAQALSHRRRTEEFVEPPPNPWLQIGPDEGFASQITTPLAVYELLDVAQVSSFEEIHRNFLRKVRALLIQEAKITDRKERFQALRKLQFLWIAHDILTDPVTRTDCDLRAIGLRGILDEIIPQAPEDASQGGPSNRTPLRIGELLLCAGLLEPTELEIAADMHKAMPEMMFGAFLVKQEFIEEDDLNTVLLGQKLLRSGVITVVQFQTAMELKRKEGKELADSLVSLGYVSQREIYAATASTQFGVNPGPPPERIEIVGQTSDGKEAPVTSLELGNAAPSWKDQLDWSEPERVHLPSVEPMTPPSPPPQKTMGSVLIDGVTDFAENDSSPGGGGKSSLRSLIAGIQAELTALDISTLTDNEEQVEGSAETTTDSTDAVGDGEDASNGISASAGNSAANMSGSQSDSDDSAGSVPTASALNDASSSTGDSAGSSNEESSDGRDTGTASEGNLSSITSTTLKGRDDAPRPAASTSDDSALSDAELLKASLAQKITDPDLPVAEIPRSALKTSERLKLNIDFELESEKVTKAREARKAAGLEAFEASGSHQIAVGATAETDSSTNISAIKSDTTAEAEESKADETFDAHPPNAETSAASTAPQGTAPPKTAPAATEVTAQEPASGEFDASGAATTGASTSPTHSRDAQEATGKIRVERPHVRTDDSEWQVFPKRDEDKLATDATDNFEPPHDESETAITDDTTTEERSSPPTTTTSSFPDPTLDAPPPHAALDEKASDDDTSSDDDSDTDSKRSISDTDAGKSGNRQKRKN